MNWDRYRLSAVLSFIALLFILVVFALFLEFAPQGPHTVVEGKVLFIYHGDNSWCVVDVNGERHKLSLFHVPPIVIPGDTLILHQFSPTDLVYAGWKE